MKGDLVVLPFPFSDLSTTKRRPALVLHVFPGDDILLAQVTSTYRLADDAILLEQEDFLTGGLPCASLVRLGRIFTADRSLLLSKAGRITTEKFAVIIDSLCALLKT